MPNLLLLSLVVGELLLLAVAGTAVFLADWSRPQPVPVRVRTGRAKRRRP